VANGDDRFIAKSDGNFNPVCELLCQQILKQDELEQELERTKEKLARLQKKASKISNEPIEMQRQFPTPGILGSSASLQDTVCEICERPGHDIFNCDLLKEDSAKMPRGSGPNQKLNGGHSSTDLFCEDCESHGHTAVDCPHSLDVF
jgi:CAP-Gly domain-containing linker protein 1